MNTVHADCVASPSEHQQIVTIGAIVHTDDANPQVTIPAWVPLYRQKDMHTDGVPHVTTNKSADFVGISMQPFTAKHERGEEHNRIPVAISGLITVAVPSELQVIQSGMPSIRPRFLEPLRSSGRMMDYEGVKGIPAPAPYFAAPDAFAHLVTTFSMIETGVRAIIRTSAFRDGSDTARAAMIQEELQTQYDVIVKRIEALEGELRTLDEKLTSSTPEKEKKSIEAKQQSALYRIEIDAQRAMQLVETAGSYEYIIDESRFPAVTRARLESKYSRLAGSPASPVVSSGAASGSPVVDAGRDAAAASGKTDSNLMDTSVGLGDGDAESDTEAGMVGEKRARPGSGKKPRKKKVAKRDELA